MNSFLDTIWSASFGIGFVVGIILQRIYAHTRCHWLNGHRPKSNGSRHKVSPVGRVWVGGLIAVLALTYVVVQADQTHRDTVALAQETRRCQQDLVTNIKRNREITTQNDDLSAEQRALLAKSLDAGSEWVNQLIVLPPDLAKLDRNDPRVQQYGIDVTRAYYDRIGKYRKRIAEINAEQDRLAEQRAQNPLSSPRCDGTD
ncbi:MAG: hypothetical protein JO214_14025 [Frankiaceae bacterium]|nr:hypothetical protein [Frankiaceae bacterium]